jgi:hypothetical protein
MTVPQAHLQEHIHMMKSVVAGKFSELVFNLDEVVSSDWEDRKPKKSLLLGRFSRIMYIIQYLEETVISDCWHVCPRPGMPLCPFSFRERLFRILYGVKASGRTNMS